MTSVIAHSPSVIASEAIQGPQLRLWIASSLSLLAMTGRLVAMTGRLVVITARGR
jgi:hypothetical protein